MGLKAFPKAVLVASAVGLLAYGANFALNAGYFKSKATVAATVPDKIDLPTGGGSAGAGTIINTQRASSNEVVRIKTLAWNATAGLHYANGGVETAPGSLMDKHGVKVKLLREDDYSKMIADLAAFAKDPSQGVHAVIIMGDGFPGFARGANDALKAFGQSVEVVGAFGYSRGEDKCVG